MYRLPVFDRPGDLLAIGYIDKAACQHHSRGRGPREGFTDGDPEPHREGIADAAALGLR